MEDPKEASSVVQIFVEEKVIVKYKNDLFDITDFLPKHPGGIIALMKPKSENFEERFNSVEHSSSAKYLLNECKIKAASKELSNHNNDDSMEHLVDWNLAMLPQISKLDGQYSEWMNKPVDRKMKLFSNLLLESLSKCAWYIPLVFWIPIVTFLVVIEMNSNNFDIVSTCLHLVGGVFIWTFIEYILHRFLFHLPVENHPWSTFHFLIHGLHHKVPFDEKRLVFPPFPAGILATLIYQIVKQLTSLFDHSVNLRLLLAGGIVGYLCYDMTHYYIHFGSPRSKYFYHIKRYHYNHHFVNHDRGFGISSPLWDKVFRTEITLKSLKQSLKW